ncbi:hypothetical protein BCON_0017g00420 [Botryotinia convoluta]|uniref:ABM domain-containing protein n=1 Tax=Botryotinia convoluta TaxID=54673 RepID=A0A4Z1IML1_9HELO|nr:hypothetical protein BCON_0017g00420 [Botryotinia convoluta]
MSQKVIIKDPYLQVQSWTRCKLPVEMPLPAVVSKNYIEDLPEIWHESLTGLMNALGFLRSRCARNVKNPEEVLFAIEWEDDASFKAFMESPAYPLYLRGFGIHDSHIPNAMVSLFPSFDYPATEQNRHDVRDAQGLLVSRRFARFGIRCHHSWIREPQTVDHGQLVEKGVVVQAWPNKEPPVLYEAVDQDENARDNLRKQVRRINPVNMEEITWNVAKVENEDEDEDEKDKKVDMKD